MNEQRPTVDGIDLVVHDVQASVAFDGSSESTSRTSRAMGSAYRNCSVGDGLDVDFDRVACGQPWDQGRPGRSGAVIGFTVQ